MKKFITWTARILAILYIAFLGFFCFDVIFENYEHNELIIALICHLLPPLVMLLILIYAWKHQKYGGLIFAVIGGLSIFFFNSYQYTLGLAVVSFPPILIGLLFIASALMPEKQT